MKILIDTMDKEKLIMDKNKIIPVENIQNLIFTIRGMQVMIDSDLAKLYGVETKNLNRAVNRNIERFPERYRFQLTKEEFNNLRFQSGTSTEHGGRRYMPYVLPNRAYQCFRLFSIVKQP